MSRAFVKEDVDLPESKRRPRGASGLPPSAANYMTAQTTRALREELAKLQEASAEDTARIDHLQSLLASVTVVEPVDDPSQIAFGARVTVRAGDGATRTYRIVGVDELNYHPDAVSWISPIGKTLLAAEPGARVSIEGDTVQVTGVAYPVGA